MAFREKSYFLNGAVAEYHWFAHQGVGNTTGVDDPEWKADLFIDPPMEKRSISPEFSHEIPSVYTVSPSPNLTDSETESRISS